MLLRFQAGFERADPLYLLMFALAEFGLGFGFPPSSRASGVPWRSSVCSRASSTAPT
ncbi:hypothetical protein [Cyanobium sp. PCC 7001]|uniref:hypothetical protein n=1 Tax=Cyanobium sp. PCC 7001 TaxID=180281 RepID=UPI0002F409DA|nr:hypothetical protein [Cyanobium sp. PCC 7001]